MTGLGNTNEHSGFGSQSRPLSRPEQVKARLPAYSIRNAPRTGGWRTAEIRAIARVQTASAAGRSRCRTSCVKRASGAMPGQGSSAQCGAETPRRASACRVQHAARHLPRLREEKLNKTQESRKGCGRGEKGGRVMEQDEGETSYRGVKAWSRVDAGDELCSWGCAVGLRPPYLRSSDQQDRVRDRFGDPRLALISGHLCASPDHPPLGVAAARRVTFPSLDGRSSEFPRARGNEATSVGVGVRPHEHWHSA